jgi:phospholipid transport system substrate-binding protein
MLTKAHNTAPGHLEVLEQPPGSECFSVQHRLSGSTMNPTRRIELLLRRALLMSLLIAIITGFAAVTAKTCYGDTTALDTTRQFVEQALKILGNKQMPVDERQEQLRNLIEPRFDFTEMARQALGPHWRELNPAQRDDFTQTFKAFIESAYLAKIGDYSGQQVQFLKQSSLGGGYVQVYSQIVQSSRAPIPLNYLCEEQSGQWKVYDITVDNVSIIANYRTQFDRVINEDGFNKLVADLKAKQQQLIAPHPSEARG